MTVRELCAQLIILFEQGHGDDVVRIYDADSESMEPVTGLIYAGGDCFTDLHSDGD